VQSVHEQLAQVVAIERREHNVLHHRTALTDRIELPDHRVTGMDLVVTICTDQ
jgi:hypothetical protein